MTPKKKSFTDFLPSLTFEKCNMDNQLGCSICVLVWLKGIYLTWRGMFGLVFRSANVTLADFYPLTHTKSKKSIWHKPKTLRPILTCTYNTQSINQSINQYREKEITENPKTEKNRSSSTTPICLLEVVIFSSLSWDRQVERRQLLYKCYLVATHWKPQVKTNQANKQSKSNQNHHHKNPNPTTHNNNNNKTLKEKTTTKFTLSLLLWRMQLKKDEVLMVSTHIYTHRLIAHQQQQQPIIFCILPTSAAAPTQ